MVRDAEHYTKCITFTWMIIRILQQNPFIQLDIEILYKEVVHVDKIKVSTCRI